MTDVNSLVHVAGADEETQEILTSWLAAAGIESRTYTHLRAFLSAERADVPGCLVIDARSAAIVMPVRGMKTCAIRMVEKPLRERELMEAVSAGFVLDREQRLRDSRQAELAKRYAKLSPRERQVMVFVSQGKLNKQIADHLGLSVITVKAHRGAVMRKMGVRALADLVRMADVFCADVVLPARSERSIPTRNDGGVDRRSGCNLAH